MRAFCYFLPLVVHFSIQAQSQRPFLDQPPVPNQNDYCVKTKSLTRAHLRGAFPFNKTDQVQVVSFKPAHESPPLIDGNLDESKFIESRNLNDLEVNELVNVLCNYTYDPKLPIDSIVGSYVFCNEPRNAVVFRDQQGVIIASLVVC